MRISIRTECTGRVRIFDFDVTPSTTVGQLKQLLVKRVENLTIITEDELRKSYFDFDGDQLDTDDNLLEWHGVEDQSRLEYIEPFQGGTRNPGCFQRGAKFLNVTDERGLQRAEWSKVAPEWRRVNRGLVLEGICENEKCKAYKKQVAISMNYRTFDVVSDPDIDKTLCPMCREFVEPTTCGFNNCWWKFEGLCKMKDKKAPQLCSSDWKYADDAYHSFDQETTETINWLRLKFEVVKNKPI